MEHKNGLEFLAPLLSNLDSSLLLTWKKSLLLNSCKAKENRNIL